MKTATIEVNGAVWITKETDRAILLTATLLPAGGVNGRDIPEGRQAWIPRSQIVAYNIEPEYMTGTIEIAAWLTHKDPTIAAIVETE